MGAEPFLKGGCHQERKVFFKQQRWELNQRRLDLGVWDLSKMACTPSEINGISPLKDGIIDDYKGYTWIINHGSDPWIRGMHLRWMTAPKRELVSRL